MKINNIFKRVLSVFLAVCIMLSLTNGLSFNVFAEEKYNAYYDKANHALAFQSGVPTVSSGLIVMPIGYFVTAYNESTDTIIGTVFVVQGKQSIYVDTITTKFQKEYASNRDIVDNYNKAYKNGEIIYVLDTLLSIGYRYKDDLGNTVSESFIRVTESSITAGDMITELSDFCTALGYNGGAVSTHAKLASESFKDRYLEVNTSVMDRCSDDNVHKSFIENSVMNGNSAVLYVSSDFVTTADAKSRCIVTPTYSKSLHSRFPRLDPCPDTASKSAVSSIFAALSQVKINKGYFAIGIDGADELQQVASAVIDVVALEPSFHKTEADAKAGTNEIVSPKEGDPLFIRYVFQNNSYWDLNNQDLRTLKCKISYQLIIGTKNVSYNELTRNVNGGVPEIIVLDASSYMSSYNSNYFSSNQYDFKDSKFQIMAISNISLADTTYKESTLNNNYAGYTCAMHIKKPGVFYEVETKTDGLSESGINRLEGGTIAGYNVYSGQPIKTDLTFINYSSFSAKFSNSLSYIFNDILNNNYSFKNDYDTYTEAEKNWKYAQGSYYRPKFTNKSSTGSLVIKSTINERSAYDYWVASGWDAVTHLDSEETSLTVYPSDVEAVKVELFDAANGRVCTEVSRRQEVYAEFTYQNNTELPVYLEARCWTNDSADSHLVTEKYVLPAGYTSVLRTEVFTILTQDDPLTISGAVYLDGLWGDASYEYVTTNNTTSNTVNIKDADVEAVKIEVIDANSSSPCTEVYKGQQVFVRFTYKNNSESQMSIDAKCSTDSNSGSISASANGVTIPVGVEARVETKVFRVNTSSDKMTITAAAYITGLWGNSSVETNSNNNTLSLSIPVKPVDVQAVKIEVIDASSGDAWAKVYRGQRVFVRFTYKNNSKCIIPIDATCYTDSNSGSISAYTNGVDVPVGTEMYVDTDVFRVNTSSDEMVINASAYMAGLWGDTTYEENKNNNTIKFTIPVGDVEVEALRPTFHIGSPSSDSVASPLEQAKNYVKYYFTNNSEIPVFCDIECVLSSEVQIINNYGQTVEIGPGETYTVTTGPFAFNRDNFNKDEYWFFQGDTENPYNEDFAVNAEGIIAISNDVYFDKDETNNVKNREYAIHTNKPFIYSEIGSKQDKNATRFYSGQPIKHKFNIVNASSFDRLFSGIWELFFNNTLINSSNFETPKYVTSEGSWVYDYGNYYRVSYKGTDTGTISLKTSAYERSAYKYWTTRGWNKEALVGSAQVNYPVHPSDVEATKIEIIDANTDTIVNEVHHGQTVYVKVTYVNNTELPVYLEARCWTDDNNGSHLKTIKHTVPGGGIRTILTDNFIIDAQHTTLTVDGAVYLEGLWGDTSYEYNETNNTISLTIPVKSPFIIREAGGLTQESVTYRRGTDVYTTFSIDSTSYDDIYDPMPLASITVYGDSELTDVIYEEDVPFCIPEGATTMAWIKWSVPHNCPDKVYVKIICDKDNIYSGEGFVNNGDNSKSLLVALDIEMPLDVTTPDTAFAKEAPYWYKSAVDFSVSDNSSLMADEEDFSSSSAWAYFWYENGDFVHKQQNASITSLSANIEPLGSTSAFKDETGKWNMKSGYGFALTANVNTTENSDITKAQSAYCVFPEFAYRTASTSIADKYGNYIGHYVDNNTAPTGFDSIRDSSNHQLYPKSGGVYGTFSSLNVKNNKLTFKVNEDVSAPVHFTPIWYPDTEYKVYVYVSDIWTPGGMISGFVESNAINIEGNLFSDYYVMEY